MPSKIRAEKEQSSESPSSMIPSLPNDLIIDILARVPRCNYPTLFLVSKHFRSLVASPEIYARRSLLSCTEACIYAFLHNYDTGNYHFNLLLGKANIIIPSLPVMPYYVRFVSVGSKIYVFGKIKDDDTKSVSLSIDCRSHMVQPLPSMPIPMVNVVAESIDEKIYVIGYNIDKDDNVMVVFNIETQMWELEITKLSMELDRLYYGTSVVIEDKIYMRGSLHGFVYGPKERKLEMDAMLNLERWKDACVIDDILYYCQNEKLQTYDPKLRRWGVVKGVELLHDSDSCALWSVTASYGGKLVVFLNMPRDPNGSRDILRAEIALERREGGEIWGEVEWCNAVIRGRFILERSLVVIV